MSQCFLSSDKIEKYTELFTHFDYYSTGTIHYRNFHKILLSMHIRLTEEQVLSLLEETKNQNPTAIKLDEFLSIIAILIEDHEMNEQMKECFKLFDLDKSSAIDQNDIKQGLGEIGMEFSQKNIEKMMKQSGCESITFETFRSMIMENN